jgi:pyruvate,water dikinase
VIAPDVIRRRRNWLSRYQAEGNLPVRFTGIPDREPEPLPEGDVLDGWAASPGRRRGQARVVRSAGGKLRAGEILVAETTDASWSPLFMRAGAIVVERGGPLSHAAILARELGLPAVLNVSGAARVLDGCTVSVDGDQGVVVIESRVDER